MSFILENVKRRDKYNDRFQRVFGTRLSLYWDNITGFDVIKFDDGWIKSGDGSMHDAVLEKYGEEGVQIIKGLIG